MDDTETLFLESHSLRLANARAQLRSLRDGPGLGPSRNSSTDCARCSESIALDRSVLGTLDAALRIVDYWGIILLVMLQSVISLS